MAGHVAGPADSAEEATDASERLAPARRRPWLGILCATCLVLAGLAWWVRAENPFDPYRDGTSHAATLVQSPAPCLGSWGVTLDGNTYVWQTMGGVPASWSGRVHGRVHIIRQRSAQMSGSGAVAATFQAQGQTIDLYGGHEPVWFYATCSIQ